MLTTVVNAFRFVARCCPKKVQLAYVALLGFLAMTQAAWATDPTLPSLGVEDDIATYAGLAIAAIGVFILAGLGGYFALLAAGVGFVWVKSMMKGGGSRS